MRAEPEGGYRILEPGERIKEGDEWFSSINGWVRTDSIGYVVKSVGLTYRRRVTAEEAEDTQEGPYRNLKVGDRIEEGDEWFSWQEAKWKRTEEAGKTILKEWTSPYRRRIRQSEVESGQWIYRILKTKIK